MILRHLPFMILCGTSALIACSGDEIAAPSEGTILVAALTTGEDQDANGYLFSVNNGRPDEIGLADTVFVTALEAGEYEVRLSGIAENCTPEDGTNPQDALVLGGDTVSVVFNVTCEVAAPPGDGGGGGLLRIPR